MSVQVINTAGNVLWSTDKAEIVAESTDVTYQVYATALGTASAVGNLYANAVSVSGKQQIYVGAGNYLTISGTTFTARALGTQSSAQHGVISPFTQNTKPA